MKIVIAALVILATAIPALSADAVKVLPPTQKILSTQNGRFVFGQISEYQRDQFLLDTSTGRLWKVVEHWPRDEKGNVVPGAQKSDVLQSVLFMDRAGNSYDDPMPDGARPDQLSKGFGEFLKAQKK